MFKNKRVRLVSVLMLILCLLAPLFSGVYGNRSVKSAGMNSNDLRASYISMAQGKSFADIDVESMTVDQLRPIAYYLSNFYIPWSTCLDNYDEEISKKTREEMVKTLQDTCGFKKDTADALVQKVFQYGLDSAQPLYCNVDHKSVCDALENVIDVKNKWELSGSIASVGSNITSFITGLIPGLGGVSKVTEDLAYIESIDQMALSMAGLVTKSQDGSKQYEKGYCRVTPAIFLGFGDNQEEAYSSGKDSDGIVKRVRYYYADDSTYTSDEAKKRIVLDSDSGCISAYGMVADKLNYSNGIGISLFTGTKEEISKVPEDKLGACLWYNSTLYVDWVGNIIVDNGLHRYIFLPACVNPYAMDSIFHVNKYKDGSYITSWELAGHHVPLQNFVGNYRFSNDLIVQHGEDQKESVRFCHVVVDKSKTSIFGFSGGVPVFRGANDTGLGILTDNCFTYLEDYAYIDVKGGASSDYVYTRDGLDGAINDCSKRKGMGCIKRGGMDEGTVAVNGAMIMLDSIKEWDGNDDSFKTYNILDSSHKMSGGSKFQSTDAIGAVANAVATGDKAIMQNVYLTTLFAFSNYYDGVTEYVEGETKLDLMFNGDAFPQVGVGELVDWSDIELSSDALQKEVLSMAYLIMHPTKGIQFVATLLKNKISGFLISWHEDIVGKTDSNAALGVAGYIGFTGYTTIPNLHDLEWTDWLLQNYNSILVYLILIIAVIMCCYIIVGQMTVQKAIIGVFIFAVLSFLPPLALNMSADLVNTTGDMIYGEKFIYWALVQHQSYLQDLYSAKNAESADAYTDFVLDIQSTGKSGSTSASSFDTVKLKWMSPKKDNYMATYMEDLQEETKASNGAMELAKGLISRATSGEEFLDSNKALYLYRDYMNVTLYALKSYNMYSSYTDGDKVKKDQGDYKLQVNSWWSGDNKNKELTFQSGKRYQNAVMANYEVNASVQHIQGYRDTSSLTAVRNGWLYNTLGNTNLDEKADYYSNDTMAVNYLLNFNTAYRDIYLSKVRLDELNGTDKDGNKIKAKEGYTDSEFRSFGIPQGKFNFTLSDMSSEEREKDKYSKENLDYFYYGLYTESPFYFFSYNITDQLKATTDYQFSLDKVSKDAGKGNFKDMILQDNMGYFFNITDNAGDGYGELRDFMNMHDLFWYVLPLMRQGNQNVREFDSLFGMTLFDDVRCNFTANGDVTVTQDGNTYIISDIKGIDGNTVSTQDSNESSGSYEFKTWKEVSKDWDKEKKYKFWHNYNVAVMFNEYSPWADTLYDCNYARGEWISVAGEKYYVENPLDPSSYFSLTKEGEIDKGRPMIFSRSELKYYGLEETQLTEVERKILRVQDTIYEKSMDLMNYFNFDDDVLLSAMAMFEVFEFNKEFSQKTVVGEDFILYPQAYELKTFSYDAYLRLILSNTTGESLQTEENKSLYTRIIEKTSIFFGILIIILDILCVYVIPAFKLFFLVMLFFMSVVMIVASAVNIELNIFSAVFKSLIKPLGMFIIVCLGLSWSVSLFMYAGNKEVTGDLAPTIRLGDPSMVCIVMLVINIIAVILYWKICKATFKDFMKYAKAVFENIAGNVAGAFKMVAGGMLAHKALNAIRGIGHGGVGGSGAGGSGGGAGGNSNEPKRRAEENDPEKPKMDGNTGGINDKSDGSGSGDALATGAAVAGAGVVAQNTGNSADSEKEAKKKETYDEKMRKGAENLNKSEGEKKSAEDRYKEHRGRAQSHDEKADTANDMRKSLKGQKGTFGQRTFLFKEEMKERAKATVNNVKGVSDRVGIAKNKAGTRIQKISQDVKSNVDKVGNNVKIGAVTVRDNVKTGVQNTGRRVKNAATVPARAVRRGVGNAKKSYQRNTQMAQASIKHQVKSNKGKK